MVIFWCMMYVQYCDIADIRSVRNVEILISVIFLFYVGNKLWWIDIVWIQNIF